MKKPQQLIDDIMASVCEIELSSPKPNVRVYLEHRIQVLVWALDDDLPEWVAEKIEIYL